MADIFDAPSTQSGGDIFDAPSTQPQPKQSQRPVAQPSTQPGILDQVGSFLSGVAQSHPVATPSKNIADPYANRKTSAVEDIGSGIAGLWNANLPFTHRLVEGIRTGNPSEVAGNIVGSIPVIGPGIQNTAHNLLSPETAATTAGNLLGGVAMGSGPGEASQAVQSTMNAVGDVASNLKGIGEDATNVLTSSLTKAVKDKIPVSLGGSIVSDADREHAWSTALRPGVNIPNWQKSVKIFPDLLKDAESDFGRQGESVHDLLPQIDESGNVEGPGLFGIAKNKLYEAKNQLEANAGAAHSMVNGDDIADAMIDSISPATKIKARSNPKISQDLQDTIDNINSTYRGQQFSVQDAEALKQGSYAETSSYQAKNAPGKADVLKSDPYVAQRVAEQKALKTGIEDAVNKTVVNPEDVDKLKQINQQLGALNDGEKAAWVRKNVLDRQAFNSLPQTLTKIESVGNMAKSALNFKFGDAAAALAKTTFADNLAESMSSNGLVKRALESHDLSGFKPLTVEPLSPIQGPTIDPQAQYAAAAAKRNNAFRESVQGQTGPTTQSVTTPTQLGQGPTIPAKPVGPAHQTGVKQPIPNTQAGSPTMATPSKAFKVVESPEETAMREEDGYKVQTVDANAFKQMFENRRKEPLAWSPERAEALKNVQVLDSYPRVSGSEPGAKYPSVDVTDGRHRIAEAANRGGSIDVAVEQGTTLPDSVLAKPQPSGTPARTVPPRNVTTRSIPKMGASPTYKTPGKQYALPNKPTNFDLSTPEGKALFQQRMQRRGITGGQ